MKVQGPGGLGVDPRVWRAAAALAGGVRGRQGHLPKRLLLITSQVLRLADGAALPGPPVESSLSLALVLIQVLHGQGHDGS